MKKRLKRRAAALLTLILAIGLSLQVQAAAADRNLPAVIQDTAEYVYTTVRDPQVGSIGGEWAVLGLARSGYDVPETALAAAGLKRPREQRREENRQKNENSLRQQEIKRAKAPRRKRPASGQTRSTEETQNMMRL